MRRIAFAAGCLIAGLSVAMPGPAAASSSVGAYTFVSAPGLHPPKLDVLERKSGLAPGDFLVHNTRSSQADGQGGPMILDNRVQPVWFMHTKGVGLDFEQEMYEGKPVLVWSRAESIVVLNEHYRIVATITAHSPWIVDGHDASIIGDDIWVVVVRFVEHQNLTRYGGPADGTVYDCGLQEYQLSSGHLIRTWDALNPGHEPNVPLSASEASGRGMTLPGHPRGRLVFDAYHLNSVQALPDGDLLVSMRNTSAVYLIDPSTGHIIWTLGGKDSTLRFGHGARFAWQHDAKLVQPADGGMGADVELTLFNDDNGQYRNNPSQAMVLRLDTITRRATLVRAYRHHPALYAVVLGSMQLLPRGNVLVGWGSEPYFSEYSPSGKELLDVEWPGMDQTYRALFTDQWVGTPYYRPRGAVRGDTVYASWNGATEVTKWAVLAGPSGRHLKRVATRDRNGFETAITLPMRYRAYAVQALSASGRTLGASKAFP